MHDHPHSLITRVERIADPLAADDESRRAIAYSAGVLRAGGLVAFPTETVYGLGADATNSDAAQRIFAAKERPYSDPLIVHITDSAALSSVSHDIPATAWALAARFWPGPLTLIVPRGPRIPPLIAAGGATIGVRAPAHPVAQALLRATGKPIAAPSANRFMRTSPTTAAHVLADLDGRIDCILDAGPTTIGVESTVLDLLSDPPRILRPGGVTLEALRQLLPNVQPPAFESSPGAAPALAPGQLARHYAPLTPLIVFAGAGNTTLAALHTEAAAALARGLRVGALLPDDEIATLDGLPVVIAALGPSSDLSLISQRLYAALRELDTHQLDLLLTHTYGHAGLGLALEDRLRRAAGGSLRAVTDILGPGV